jgi:WD40 repeat protein
MTTTRRSHTATLLTNGKVLVAGGYNVNPTANAELYDPGTGQWAATGNMTTARLWHTATLLPNGKVLVAGGSGDGVLASAELYDPTTGQWTATGSMATARLWHTATLLPNGKVLVAAGADEGFIVLSSAELYDPATGLWTATGSMTTARVDHTATLLPNGKVLVAGGSGASAELYDPTTGQWTVTGSMTTTRVDHTATLLPNGEVLVAAGVDDNPTVLSSAELYNPATEQWTATGSMITARYWHTATLLPNGKVLVAAGFNLGINLSSAELYDPSTGLWTATGSMTTARIDHTATLLPNGKVLVTAGVDDTFTVLASAELYESPTGALEFASAASVKGPWAIDLPPTGASGVEDRSGGPNKKYTVVMTFNQNITSVESASSTCGGVQSIVIDSADAHKVKINLVNVAHGCNGSTITVTADSITDDQGNVLDSASVGLGLLLGDVNGDRVVNHSDYHEAQMHKGERADPQNFRSDVNADGHITPSDIQLIRQQQGTSLP